jgi:sugar ABC transporter, permease protein
MTAKKKAMIKKNVEGYLYIAPVLLGILIFTALPVIYAFISSFFETSLKPFSLTDWGEFVGLDNYIRNFTRPSYRSRFFTSLGVTFLYAAINIPLTLVLSFALALMLNQKLKGMRFFRVLYYLPCLIPAVCSGLLWNRITDTNTGIINKMLTTIGLPEMAWFSTAESCMPSFIFVNLFTLGGNMILWLAQLKNVPDSLYESARLDGAGKLRQLFAITVPICTPMILYNVIMSIIGVMQTYAQVVTLTGGSGKDFSLLFYVINIYDYRLSEFGYASALSFILFLIIALLTLVTMKTSKWVYYSEEG